jgi:hypothetical protein
MKIPLPTLAIATAVLALGTLSLSAGESRKPSPSASAKAVVHSAKGVHHRTVTERRNQRQTRVWNPCACGVTPIQAYRYGDPMAPVSNIFYGLPSIREVNFYRNYPVLRGH